VALIASGKVLVAEFQSDGVSGSITRGSKSDVTIIIGCSVNSCDTDIIIIIIPNVYSIKFIYEIH
jgi:hypothetical protein